MSDERFDYRRLVLERECAALREKIAATRAPTPPDRPVLAEAKSRAGKIGGRVRSDRMTPEERKRIAALGGKGRWAKWRRRRRIAAGFAPVSEAR